MNENEVKARALRDLLDDLFRMDEDPGIEQIEDLIRAKADELEAPSPGHQAAYEAAWSYVAHHRIAITPAEVYAVVQAVAPLIAGRTLRDESERLKTLAQSHTHAGRDHVAHGVISAAHSTRRRADELEGQ